VNNKRYSTELDSTITKYIIPEDEDISYEIAANNKRYDATFYQKSVKYDSLINEGALLFAKDILNDKEKDRINPLIEEISQSAKKGSFNGTIHKLRFERVAAIRWAVLI
jgi:predicted house-cleaning noncanonical NTP pyrophosphatase (MazG superfamily)